MHDCRLPAILALALALQAGVPAARAAPGPPADDLQEIADTVNEARAGQHLAPLRLDPDLTRAAQAQADAMSRGNYFALRGPDGRGIDELVAETGYQAALLTEKLARSSKQPAMLGLQWSLAASEQAASLFHPEMTELGVGIGSLGDERLYVLVLAKPAAPSAPPADPAGLADLAAARAAYLAQVARERARRGLPELRPAPALERAAQAHAEALLAARLDGRPEPGGTTLAERVDHERSGFGRTGIVGATSAGSRDVSRLEREVRGQVEAVGAAVVTDALDGESAARLALEAAGSALGEAGYRGIGVGLAWRLEGRTLRTVWVACLSHRLER